MQLDESYDILEFTQHEGIVVSRARERKTGKLVQIHLFPNEKIPEATQICARLLSLPGEARGKVLHYGQNGNSPYFVTEPLPEGEGLGEWVLRMAAPRAAARPPEVSGGAVGNLRRMDIEPAALRPLPPGPASRRTLVEQDVPRTGPAPSVAGPPKPTAPGPGEFTLLYTGEEIQTPHRSSPDRPTPPSPPVSPMPSTPSVGFTGIYGEQDLQTPEPADFPQTAPTEVSASSQAGPGLETFIGMLKLAPPTVPPPPRGAPPQPAPPPLPAEATPRFEAPQPPPTERVSRPLSVRRSSVTFPVPGPQPPDREPADLFSMPPAPPPPPPAPAVPQPIVRPPEVPEARRAPAPLFSMRVATLAALGLIGLAAVVALIVEVSG